MQKPMFEVETKPLYYTRAPGSYTSVPRTNKIGHTSMDKIAVHFWKLVYGVMTCWSVLTIGQQVHFFASPAMVQRDEQHSSVAAV